MNKQTEALKMAIVVMQAFDNELPTNSANEAIQACKEALEPDRTGMVYYKNNACKAKDANSPDCICWTPEQPAQEPVAWMYERDNGAAILEFYGDLDFKGMKVKPLYTHPAPSWQKLSDDDIEAKLDARGGSRFDEIDDVYDFARAIEQALKEKNTCTMTI